MDLKGAQLLIEKCSCRFYVYILKRPNGIPLNKKKNGGQK